MGTALAHCGRALPEPLTARRTLLDGSAAADPARGHAAVDASGAAAWPTAWLLLRPVRAGPGAAGAIYGPNEVRRLGILCSHLTS